MKKRRKFISFKSFEEIRAEAMEHIPNGYAQVTEGRIQDGDLSWMIGQDERFRTVFSESEHINCIGLPVNTFYCIIRPLLATDRQLPTTDQ